MPDHSKHGGVPLRLAAAIAVWLGAVQSAVACDLCAIYTATEMRETRNGFLLGVSEQFTHFTTLKDDGEEIDNVANERLDSSITQLLLGYNFNQTFGLQLTLPVISRKFRRLESAHIRHGDESGVGDLSLLGVVRPYRWIGEDSVFRVSLLGGLKLPSGSTSRLDEETEEDHVDEGDAADDHDAHHEDAAATLGRGVHRGAHGDTPSGVHGHDLTLGTGSVDGIIGGQVYYSWRRAFLATAVQYVIRTEGAVDYRYANDLLWNGGPGAFLLLDHEYVVTAQAVVSGEHKGKDSLGGVDEGDTAITAVYLGPAFAFSWGTSLSADVGADFPISQDNSGLQLVPDYRLHGGVAWRF